MHARRHPSLARSRGIIFALLLTLIAPIVRGQSTVPVPMPGYGAASAQRERQIEQRLIAEIKPDTLRALVAGISREVHVAGTPAQAHTRDFVTEHIKRAGLRSAIYPYEVYMPHAKSSSLEMISPAHKTFKLKESQDVKEEIGDVEYPWANGYSASGTATAPIVYVNFGLHEDYRVLDSLGVSVKGKIVIARYGRSYRGIKALLAEQHGAVGLIIFSDPSGDGFVSGDVFPKGPMRNADAVQRGSIWNGHGDPTTPGYASIKGAKRLPLDSIALLPHIPVIPISYGVANDLLASIGGREVPNADWQGALAFRYHIGGNDVKVKLSVRTDTALKPIFNTIATVVGSEWPDEWVIVGGHRDAWCHGAEDNASGCASVVAAAEAFSRLAASGMRPKRSVLFATWDAEEWGLIGSTEWVEQFEPELREKAVAYINQDMCATGSSFGAGADPTLRTLVYDVSKLIPETDTTTIYTRWSKGSSSRPEIGLLGGGSDFGPFYNHLGIPSLEHGFGGAFGQYHSQHDNMTWTTHFGDTTFKYHALASQFAAIEAMRLANADTLPYDFVALSQWLAAATASVRAEAGARSMETPAAWNELETAIQSFRQTAENFVRLRPGADTLPVLSPLSAAGFNRGMRDVGRALTEQNGLYSDQWERNMLVISDPQNGYADLKLPGIQIAMRSGRISAVDSEVRSLAAHIQRAAQILAGMTKGVK